MAIQIQEGFRVGSPSPIDTRSVVTDKVERDSLRPYEGMLTYVKSEKQHYLYEDGVWNVFPRIAVNEATYRLVKYTESVEATVNNQKEFVIPILDYDSSKHLFDVVIGSVFFSSTRYSIVGNKIVLDETEDGIEKGRRVDFIITYLDNSNNVALLRSAEPLKNTTRKKRSKK